MKAARTQLSGRLALIPARGGSQRIPRKNVRPFAGVPMIEYAIRAARTSGLFEHIVVSTEDAEIAGVARAAGAELPFMRPADLADAHTPTVPVVAHAIQACRLLGWRVETVCCIYPGVPLLPDDVLAAGLALLERGDCNYAFPVQRYRAPIQRALRRDAAGHTLPFHPEHASTRTQDLEPAYHDAGQFYWGHARAWLSGAKLHGYARTLLLPDDCAVDIDTPDDWARAEALYGARDPLRAASLPMHSAAHNSEVCA
jgi:pseudaminic acid cytidylyltransferase